MLSIFFYIFAPFPFANHLIALPFSLALLSGLIAPNHFSWLDLCHAAQQSSAEFAQQRTSQPFHRHSKGPLHSTIICSNSITELCGFNASTKQRERGLLSPALDLMVFILSAKFCQLLFASILPKSGYHLHYSTHVVVSNFCYIYFYQILCI